MNHSELGHFSLHFALVLAIYTVVSAILSAKLKRPSLLVSAQNGLYAVSFLVLFATVMLLTCLLTGQFDVIYVQQYTNSTMPTFYKFAALWGGQDGSLLFWLLILCVLSTCVLIQNRGKNQALIPYVIVTLTLIAAFFLILLIFVANPFETVPYAVKDGKGLNPLLQNYYMIIHPPSLYLGYVGMSIPFAFAMAALITGRLDNVWIKEIRFWSLLAWFFLSIGNLLGASWAYEVLGWGGYWAWDPVENAAFIPWLTSTAFLHSAIIQEKRDMLKTWNMVLVILSFIMTLLGTFLTRSGIVSSVHSFAQSNIGSYFLVFLALVIMFSFGLLFARLNQLKSQSVLDSMISRETAFLLNNLVLVGMAFAILWGTLFPVLSEWVRGSKITVGPPYFNALLAPIGLFLLLLTGIGPIVGWRKTTANQLKQHFFIPSLLTILTSIACLFLLPKTSHWLTNIYVNACIALCAFVFSSIIMEYKHGIKARQNQFQEDAFTSTINLIKSNQRRYGGYIVHFGVVLLFFGFAGNAFQTEREVKLKVKQTTKIKHYTIQYDQLQSGSTKHFDYVTSKLKVWRNSKPAGLLKPSRIFYKNSDPNQESQPSTEIAILRTLKEDFYTALLTFDPKDNAIFLKVVINPLVQWIWIGGLFVILGGVIVLWPRNRDSHVS